MPIDDWMFPIIVRIFIILSFFLAYLVRINVRTLKKSFQFVIVRLDIKYKFHGNVSSIFIKKIYGIISVILNTGRVWEQSFSIHSFEIPWCILVMT